MMLLDAVFAPSNMDLSASVLEVLIFIFHRLQKYIISR
jgi:hypothetical protein